MHFCKRIKQIYLEFYVRSVRKCKFVHTQYGVCLPWHTSAQSKMQSIANISNYQNIRRFDYGKR